MEVWGGQQLQDRAYLTVVWSLLRTCSSLGALDMYKTEVIMRSTR